MREGNELLVFNSSKNELAIREYFQRFYDENTKNSRFSRLTIASENHMQILEKVHDIPEEVNLDEVYKNIVISFTAPIDFMKAYKDLNTAVAKKLGLSYSCVEVKGHEDGNQKESK